MNGETKLRQLSGKIVKNGLEMLMLFKVGGIYYPGTDSNVEIIETYLHTGDQELLKDLTNEMEA